MGEILIKNIKGQVIDSFTNKPIKGVNIQILDLSENKNILITPIKICKTDEKR
jgi:hypothetical protein